jgi:hypothetical protein
VFLPGGSIITTRQQTNTQITQNNTTKIKQTNKNKLAHKAAQTVKDILQPMNTS